MSKDVGKFGGTAVAAAGPFDMLIVVLVAVLAAVPGTALVIAFVAVAIVVTGVDDSTE